MQKYITYAEQFNESKNTPKVKTWIETVLAKYLLNNLEQQDEIEHIIDYLSQTKKDIKGMSYEAAKKNAELWSKAQQKKGRGIKETENDTEIVLDFNDGFKVVKLIGENAYKREGAIMGHCVASYYGKGKTIYSLRDRNNIPHCTMEEGQQVKGRGNGDVVGKYVDYVVKFLEHIGMTVGDNEMAHLGYVNVDNIRDENAVFPNLYAKKYFPKKDVDKILDKDGNKYENITLWSAFGLFDFTADLKVKMNFSIENCISIFKKMSAKWQNKGDSNEVAMDDSNKVAMDDSNTVAMNDSNKVAMNDYNEVAMRIANKVAMNDFNTVAMDDSNTVAMNDSNKVAMDDSNKVAMRNSNEVAMDDYNEVAMNDFNEVAMDDYNKVAMRDYNTVAMNDSNKVAMNDYNIACGNSNNEVAFGLNTIVVCGDGSKVRGKIGSWFTLFERNNDGEIIHAELRRIDGKKIKEDMWYTLKNGKIVEVQ